MHIFAIPHSPITRLCPRRSGYNFSQHAARIMDDVKDIFEIREYLSEDGCLRNREILNVSKSLREKIAGVDSTVNNETLEGRLNALDLGAIDDVTAIDV